TRGALAEMRTLLLELRPAALTEAPFVQLLTQLGEAIASRSNLQATVRTQGQPILLPPEVQIALYRVAQEALNNTSKHAEAAHVEIHVRWHTRGLDVRLRDDGRGFVRSRVAQGRLGLGIMQERARSIGAELRLRSQPGVGTTVTIAWRAAPG
ncbi:MAG: histidine kinase, partial [Chloroflexi bacterium]|nr:histidine kinase [Chloroflexota bacterium]